MIALSAGLIISRRRAALRGEARLAALARGVLPAQQPRARRPACLVLLWGTFFPLISEAITGTKASVGPPWFNRLVTPLALVLVLLAGIGPVLAWRRFTPAALRRILSFRWRVAGATLVLLVALTDAADSPTSLAMFCLVAFVLAVVGQELWRGAAARRTMTGEALAARAARLTGRNRRRYGGYLVHAGWPCCSSAWRRRRPSSTSATCGSRPATRRGRRLPGDLPRGRPPSIGAAPGPARRSRSARCSTCARTASASCCARRAATTRPATRRSARSGASSRARRPARSA